MNSVGIFPPNLTTSIRNDPRRRAEVVVYDKLQEQLSGFAVFYNCPWYDEYASHSTRDGEADFIVAHPKWGFVVLEVKGGVISRDEHTKIWKSRNRNGQEFEIKNPVEQALTSKHVILRKLRDSWKGHMPFIRAKHGVIMPDSGRPVGVTTLGADMPLDIFAFAEDIAKLGLRVVHILMAEPVKSSTKYDDFGKQGLQLLHDFFDRGFDLQISMASMLEEDDRKIINLTEQQNSYLDLTANQQQAVFTGGAGTGKTTLAVEKAKRLAREGNCVLFVCYNAALAAYLTDELEEYSDQILVSTFHQFCSNTAYRSGVHITKQNDGNKSDYFDNILPNALMDALSTDSQIGFDAVIVDEGQDFKDNWWIPLQLTLRSDNGAFFAFKDDNQKIFRDQSQRVPDLPVDPLHLSVNFRNTKAIFRATINYYDGGKITPGGPDGLDLVWHEVKQGRETRGVEKVIDRLINIEGIQPGDITVLCACAAKKSSVGSGNKIGRYETTKAENFDGSFVRFDSVHRFKGLESKVVILTDLHAALNSTELLYVGLSRARLLLIIVGVESTLVKLRRAFSVASCRS